MVCNDYLVVSTLFNLEHLFTNVYYLVVSGFPDLFKIYLYIYRTVNGIWLRLKRAAGVTRKSGFIAKLFLGLNFRKILNRENCPVSSHIIESSSRVRKKRLKIELN